MIIHPTAHHLTFGDWISRALGNPLYPMTDPWGDPCIFTNSWVMADLFLEVKHGKYTVDSHRSVMGYTGAHTHTLCWRPQQKHWLRGINHAPEKKDEQRENGGTLGMVPLIINPIYTLYSGHFLGASWGVKQLAHHPKGTIIFPMR